MTRGEFRYRKPRRFSTLSEIRNFLDPLDGAPTECDGQTRILHFVLNKVGVDHRVMLGSLYIDDEEISPHMWIELVGHPHTIVDYRARMWAGEHAPHGIFDCRNYPSFRYVGEMFTPTPLGEGLIRLLAMPVKLPTDT